MSEARIVISDTQDVDGPIFTTPNKSEIILQAGQNYTLLCRANRPVTIKQQDIPEEVTSNFTAVMQNVKLNEDLNEYEVALSLYNVDHSAVGYYGCFDSTVDSQQVLKDIDKEPSNTKHISYIYVYVNGEVQTFYEFCSFLYYLRILYLVIYIIFRHKIVRTNEGVYSSKKSDKYSN